MLIEAKKEASKILNVVHYEEITNVCESVVCWLDTYMYIGD